MEFLYDQFKNFQSRWKNGKIFMEDALLEDSTPTGENNDLDAKKPEVKKKTKLDESCIDRVLNGHFLYLSVNDLGKASKAVTDPEFNNPEKKKDFEKKFKELVEYYISVCTDDVDQLPSRILARIYQTPNLKKFLSSKERKIIAEITKIQEKTLKAIVAKSPNNWTGSESIRVCTLYKSLKGNESLKKLFEKTKEVLQEKRQIVVNKFTVEGEVKSVLEGTPPTREERLFLLEIAKLFPNETDWPDDGKKAGSASEKTSETIRKAGSESEQTSGTIRKEFDHWKKLQNQILKDLVEDIVSEKSKEKIRPENYLLWEVLQETDFSEYEGIDIENEIEKLAVRWNATQFLTFMKEHGVLSPQQVKILNEISNDEDELFQKQYIRPYEEIEFKDRKELIRIKEKIEDIQEERKKIERQICEDVLSKKKTPAEERDATLTEIEGKYKDNEGTEKETKEKVQALLNTDRFKELHSQLEAKATEEAKKQGELLAEINQTEEKITNIEQEIKNLEGFITQKKEALDKLSEIESKEKNILQEEYSKLLKTRNELVTNKQEWLKNASQLAKELPRIKNNVEALKKGAQKINKDFIENSKKDKESIKKYIESSAEKLNWIFRELDRVDKTIVNNISFILDWEKAHSAYTNADKALSISRDALLKENSYRTEEQDKAIEELKAEEEKLRDKERELNKKNNENHNYRDIYEDPKSVSEEIKKKYYDGFEKRIKNHTLTSTDLGVLWSEQDSGKYKEYTKYEEFRKKFEEVLNELKGEKLFNSEDSLEACIEALDDKLSNVAFLNKLKGKGFDVFDEFKKEIRAESLGDIPFDVTVLIEGAKMHFRQEINEYVEQALENIQDEESRKEFRKHWNEVTLEIRDNKDMMERGFDQQRYANQRTHITQTIEKEKAKCEKVIHNPKQDRLTDESEKKDEFGKNEEVVALDGAVDRGAEKYRRGNLLKYSDGEKEIFVPGADDLNELTTKTQENARTIKKTTESLRHDLQSLAKRFEKWTTSDPQTRETLSLSEEDLKQELTNLLNQWSGGKHKLKQSINMQREICMQHADIPPQRPDFKDKFVEVYYENVYVIFNKIDKSFENLKNSGMDYSLMSDIWEELGALRSSCDFRDGILAQEVNRQKENYKSQAKVIERLDEEGFWKEQDVDNFVDKLRKIKGEYAKKFGQYETNLKAISRVIMGDLKNLDDKEFIEHYKIDKSAARTILQDHQAQKENFDQLWGEMTGGSDKKGFFDPNSPDFEADWVSHYKEAVRLGQNDGGNEMHNVLARLNNLEAVTSNVKMAEKASDELASWLKDYADKKGKQKGAWGRFRFNASEFSLYDVYRVFKESFEATNKHWKRNSDKHVAHLGVTFWGEDNRWGREFARMQEESEGARFKEFETQYHDQPGWVILKAIRKSKNPDMVRGCINLLSEKGFLRWDDPIIWEALNRLSRNTYFNIPEDFKLSPHEILEKVKLACEDVWTTEVFRQWETGLEGNLKKAKEQFDGEFAKYENDDRPRTEIMAGMLQRWSQGEVEDVDPARYEHFLFASFRDGKMNGQPDQRWYFLIMGISTRNPRTGQALLSKDVMMRINKEFLQRFPFVDFLADKESPKLHGRIVPKGTPGTENRSTLWEEEDYQNWARMLGTGNGSFNPKREPANARTEAFFYQVISESLTCKQRVQRMGRFAQAPDHDDGVNYQFIWDQNRVMENLNIESTGRGQLSEDFWRSWLSGFDKFIRNKKAMIAHGDANWRGQEFWEKDRQRHLIEIGKNLKVALTVTQTLQGNKGTQRGPTTFDEDEWEKESGYSIHAETSRRNVNDMMRFMMQAKGTNEYDDILEKKLRDEFGKDEKSREGRQEWKDLNKKVRHLLDEKDGDEQYFKRTDLVERALDLYCSSRSDRAAAICIL